MIQKPPGVEDIFPDRITRFNYIINTAKEVFRLYNYREVILPIMEYTEVFARGIGDATDIVTKEMFTFEDRGGRSLTLRPEGTASMVRAYVENGEYNRLSLCKFFYCGPMFRAERPQKGRLRQFNQFGAELFGSDHPYFDFEILSIMNDIATKLHIHDYELLLNSIGCPDCRKPYITELFNYYKNHEHELCDDCKKRLYTNPLRLLDCKVESCVAIKQDAPKITQFLCKACNEHFDNVQKLLQKHTIKYSLHPLLVRGLDYYTKTTFEFVTAQLGGQNAFAAGGRYNNLVELFGGKPTPAIGFAAGIERIELLLEQTTLTDVLDVYIIYADETASSVVMHIANLLRKNNISCDFDPITKGFKTQFKRADREKAKFAIIVGQDELANNSVTIKDMTSGEQIAILQSEVINFLLNKLTKQ
ncbi:MAG TPA: histidine--tRNA ligase [Spirochaetota bacterium]|nr:histidine--tRNA ligase [Spirochaetota bacterium]HPD04658.1 histidine--tRNA ligase [Spirochaetota bacterium]HQI37473.1 histidine--tRNA ligase [Spirochaetota bacterium]HQK08318.1 histidine--tRNA ligase [Spirochaetota bacterium]HRR61438.1 histidine--tRNA ligase [Spirochaetota bacterium]